MFRKSMAVVGIAGLVGLTGCAAEEEMVTFTTEQGWEASVPAGTMEPCKYDDGTGAPCVWVASERGNGEGTSFVVLERYNGPWAMISDDMARKLSK